MKKIGLSFAVVFALVASAAAVEWHPLSVPEMAAKGATHVAEIKYSDLTVATTNAIQAFTNAIPAKTAVQFVGLVLDKAFDTENTNYTGSVALKVGDGSTDNLFLTSTELASDGAEVWVKYGPPNSASLTVQSADGLSSSSNVMSVVTNVSSTATVGELSRKLYPTAGSIVYTLTPNAQEALSANKTGSVRLYFKLLEYGK